MNGMNRTDKVRARTKRARNMRRSKQAALEGMPLYLIILVVVAAASIGVIMTWVAKMDKDPVDTITAEGYCIETKGDIIDMKSGKIKSGVPPTIVVTVYDDDGNRLDRVAVTVKGCGLDASGLTKGNATYGNSFVTTGQMPTLPAGQSSGIITITAMTADGLTSECTMMVVR